MAGKQYILFDHDGVLVDTEYWYYFSTQQTMAELGVELPEALYLKRMVKGLNSWDLALEAGRDADTVKAKQLQRDERYRAYLAKEDIEIPGVIETLDVLSQDYRLAIVTTSKGADFDVIHRDRDIVSYMDFVLRREDYERSKPNPEPYLLAMERFDATPNQCLVVEDSQRGLKAAIAAGIDCVIVHNDFTASHDFSGANHFIEKLEELPGLLATAYPD